MPPLSYGASNLRQESMDIARYSAMAKYVQRNIKIAMLAVSFLVVTQSRSCVGSKYSSTSASESLQFPSTASPEVLQLGLYQSACDKPYALDQPFPAALQAVQLLLDVSSQQAITIQGASITATVPCENLGILTLALTGETQQVLVLTKNKRQLLQELYAVGLLPHSHASAHGFAAAVADFAAQDDQESSAPVTLEMNITVSKDMMLSKQHIQRSAFIDSKPSTASAAIQGVAPTAESSYGQQSQLAVCLTGQLIGTLQESHAPKTGNPEGLQQSSWLDDEASLQDTQSAHRY